MARLAYIAVPMIDTVIELATVLTNVDIRKEARQLSDIGLIGMDAKEIIEHVNA
jgi:aspartyl/asparaginyl beta-hydroxylase (cupin superfamily)